MISEHVVSAPSVRIAERLMRLDCVAAAAIVLLLALLIGYSIYAQTPRIVEPTGSAAFSTSRALQHLSVIAAKPHPSGSAANAEVRDYLMRELSAAGLETQTQHSTLYSPSDAPKSGVENVLARLRGTGNGRAVLLVAHYDSG